MPRRPRPDFVNRLAEAGRRFSASSGGEEATISIILDGENAWEHFEGGGRPFLRALYGKLVSHPELRPVTMSEAAARPGAPLNGIFPGLVDRRQLLHLDRPRGRPARLAAAARRAADVRPRVGDVHPADGPRAGVQGAADRRRQRLVLVVRRRPLVRPRPRVRRAVPAPPAERLSDARAAGAGGALRDQHQHQPCAALSVVAARRASCTRRWTAGRPATSSGCRPAWWRPTPPAGTMTGGERREPEVRTLLFGFDLEHLYLRLDLSGPAAPEAGAGPAVQRQLHRPRRPTRLVVMGPHLGPGRRAPPEGCRRQLGARSPAAPGASRRRRSSKRPCRSRTWVCGPTQPLRLLRDDSQRTRSNWSAIPPTGRWRAPFRNPPSKN